jgi:hypothetical protein
VIDWLRSLWPVPPPLGVPPSVAEQEHDAWIEQRLTLLEDKQALLDARLRLLEIQTDPRPGFKEL